MTDKDLSTFIEDITGDSYLRVQENLGDGFVRLRAREAQRRQAKQDITCFEDVVLELLRNARDASAKNIYVASWKENGRRFLTVLDDGEGIPQHLHATVFEPFVTSKLDTFHEDRWGVHGRGMALYSIKENTDSAVVKYSEPGLGSAIAVNALTHDLSEKIDQSTLPYIHVSDSNEQVMRGPKNLMRTAMEFALDARNSLSIYFGSPVEIAATLAKRSCADGDGLSIAEADSVGNYLQYIYDPETFSERAEELGLPLSSRSARRIINDEIEPLGNILDQLLVELPNGRIVRLSEQDSGSAEEASGNQKEMDIYRDRRKVKIAQEDLELFAARVNEAFDELASKYYLERSEEPKVRTVSGKLTISIPFNMEQ